MVNPRQSKAPGVGTRGRSEVKQSHGAPWGVAKAAEQVLEGSDLLGFHALGWETVNPEPHGALKGISDSAGGRWYCRGCLGKKRRKNSDFIYHDLR